MVLKVVAFDFKGISAMCHRHKSVRYRSRNSLHCLGFVKVGAAGMNEYDLLGGNGCVVFTEVYTIVQTEVVFWVRHAYLVFVDIPQKSLIVMVAFDHNAIYVLELVLAFHCVCHEQYSFLCRCHYKKAIIWHVVRHGKGLDSKSLDTGSTTDWEAFYAL